MSIRGVFVDLQDIWKCKQATLGGLNAAVGLDCRAINAEAQLGAVDALVRIVHVLAHLLLQLILAGAGGHTEGQLARRHILRVEIVQCRSNNVLVHLTLDLNVGIESA